MIMQKVCEEDRSQGKYGENGSVKKGGQEWKRRKHGRTGGI